MIFTVPITFFPTYLPPPIPISPVIFYLQSWKSSINLKGLVSLCRLLASELQHASDIRYHLIIHCQGVTISYFDQEIFSTVHLGLFLHILSYPWSTHSSVNTNGKCTLCENPTTVQTSLLLTFHDSKPVILSHIISRAPGI